MRDNDQCYHKNTPHASIKCNRVLSKKKYDCLCLSLWGCILKIFHLMYFRCHAGFTLKEAKERMGLLSTDKVSCNSNLHYTHEIHFSVMVCVNW